MKYLDELKTTSHIGTIEAWAVVFVMTGSFSVIYVSLILIGQLFYISPDTTEASGLPSNKLQRVLFIIIFRITIKNT